MADLLTTPRAEPFVGTELPEATSPRHEVIDGSLHVTPSPGVEHQVLVAAIATHLQQQVSDNLVVPAVNVSPDAGVSFVIPDVVVVAPTASGLWVHPRDVLLAVEVASTTTRRHDRLVKRELCAEWGIAYWFVDPDDRSVTRFGDVDLAPPVL